MVLKNSKWDKKAKYKFMKKHGLSNRPKEDAEDSAPKAKWSSKKSSSASQAIQLDDSDEEWDSDTDDALINHFYPQIGETDLTRDQKIKIKQQILRDIENGEVDVEGTEEEDAEYEQPDGIYLGSKENEEKEMAPPVKEKFNLEEFMANLDISKPKNRKLPKNKMSDNFLEDYGLSSYGDITKKEDDYNDLFYAKRGQRNIKDIPVSELDGFVIGEQSLSKAKKEEVSNVRFMSEEEKQIEKERSAKAEQAKFYNAIRSKFDDSKRSSKPKGKVLEINNINASDSQQISSLNTRLVNSAFRPKQHISDADLDADIDYLLYGDSKPERKVEEVEKTTNSDFLDDILAGSKGDGIYEKEERRATSSKRVIVPPKEDLAFLDDLLK
ncbi:uncharacterized protein RJT20DRAFT_141881 [Scheffersomyces xylosifermentans]|uniref:uncharacterized protein n=1 Tax=Scheffersomyces xylosifermentans TaxID=1304137 RepID=UPI00315DBF0C